MLTAAEIKHLRCVEKVVKLDWQPLLSAMAPGEQKRLPLLQVTSGPTRGTFTVYARRGSWPDDYSTGLMFENLGGEVFTLLRLNGPHPNRHTNRLAPRVTLGVTTHAHYLTERYLKASGKRGRNVNPDGYALETTGYNNLTEAVASLGRRANIVPATWQLPFPRVGRHP